MRSTPPHWVTARQLLVAVGRKGYRATWTLSNLFSRQNLYPFVKRQARALNEEGRATLVLNIGAGGEVAQCLRALRAKVLSVDIAPERAPDVVADVCDLNMFADESVDAIFMIEVLEHVKTPERALAEVRRVLRPGGLLLLSTPFLFEIHDAPHDFYRYTRHGLEYLLRGFREVDVRARNGYFSASLVPLIRLTQSHRFPDLPLGLAILSCSLLGWPLIRALDLAISSSSATTGYVARCAK